MFAGRPIIGVVGGIGSGKTFVARQLESLGCFVLGSDDLARDAYRDPAVQTALRNQWGDEIFDADGGVDRRRIADRVFNHPQERAWLEKLIHPWIDRRREALMAAAAQDERVVAFVWDSPLLFEAGLADRCDAVIFVDAPWEIRLRRVLATRGWNENELLRREKSQLGLDTKRHLSDHVINNTADAIDIREQLRTTLSRILASKSRETPGT